jgi:hypothetical protein
MTRSNHFRKALVPWTILLALCGVAWAEGGAAQPPGAGDPLRIVPADALFCLQIRNLNDTLTQVDQFLTGVSPIGVSMPVRSQLGQLLGTAQPTGINMSGNFAAFGFLPGGEGPNPSRIGVLVPVSDYQQFLKNPNVAAPNAQGISLIGPEGKQSLAAVQIGSYVLLTHQANQQALLQMKNMVTGPETSALAKRLSPEELKRATSSPVWAYMNVQVAAKMFGPMLEQKLQEAEKTLQGMPQTPGAPMMQPQAVIGMYRQLLQTLMQETQFISLSLYPSPTVVRTAFVAAAMPDTAMAKVLSTSPGGPQPNLTGYLENGAVVNFVAAPGPALLRALMTRYMDLAMSIMSGSLPPDQTASIQQLAKEWGDMLGGALAFSLLPAPQGKPPFTAKYAFTVQNKQAFNQLLDKVVQMLNEGALANLYKNMGLKMQLDIKRNASTYKGVPIDALRVNVQALDANSPQAQIVKAIYGAGFDARLAFMGNLLLEAVAQNPDQVIQGMIDQAQSSGTPQVASDVQAALQLLPNAKQATFFGTLNFLRALPIVTSFLPMPVQLPPAEVSPQSSVAFASHVGDGRLLSELAVPKQHVLDVVTFIGKIREQEQKQKQQEAEKQSSQAPGQKQNPQGSQRL